MPSSLQLMIQLVQHDIRTQRAKWTSLRYSHFGIHEPSAFHCACLEVFMNQRNHSPVLDISGQNLYQLALIDCVKELLQVHIHRPHIALFQILPAFPKCVLRASSRTEAVACFCEFRFVDRCQHLCYALLDNSVYCCWNSQLSFLAVLFGYLYPPYRLRTVPPVHDGFPDFLAIVFEIL